MVLPPGNVHLERHLENAFAHAANFRTARVNFLDRDDGKQHPALSEWPAHDN